MRKKVLIAEETDTTRAVAETLLRQNGYEVISVSDADRAEEVLEFSRPDLIVISADLSGDGRMALHEKIRRASATAHIPMLLFEPANKSALDLPPEVIVPRPFDPRDFLTKVAAFMGQPDRKPNPIPNPLGGTEVDDDFLDAALGLDHLDVTDSEVMDKTTLGARKQTAATSVESIGLHAQPQMEEANETGKVESLMIRDDSSQIRRRPGATAQSAPLEGSSKLEILSDQYGLNDPEALRILESDVHDYDWFVSSMKTDSPRPATTAPKSSSSPDGSVPALAGPSGTLDSVKLPSTPMPLKATGSPAVEKFIDEFKKEIEQLRTEENETLSESAAAPRPGSTGKQMIWDETLENLTPEQVAYFTREFAAELGRKVAEMVVAKIDADKLLHLIKSELLARRR